MEFWEGAILVVGGVWLVAHMANRNKQAQASVVGTSILGSAGTSNASNLTNITNTAGGTPTIYGEPLEPMQPSFAGPVSSPVSVSPTPLAQPLYQHVSSLAPRSGVILSPNRVTVRAPIARPIDVML